MSWQELGVDVFLERLSEVPDIEAVQEIDLRLRRIYEQRSEVAISRLKDTPDGHARLAGLKQDEGTLRAERHLIIMRMDRRKWSKAVKAIWGAEGVEQVLLWFETSGDPDTKQAPLYPKGDR